MNWTAFWDSYESAVHNNTDLSAVQKFTYLRSLLERTAYDVVAGLTLSYADYREAIKILKKRFGDTQLIISRHMETLLSTEAVTSEHNLKGLRRLHDEVESHIRSLKALGVESESYGTMLASVFLGKLPSEFRLIITRKTGTDELKMDDLLKMMSEELVARERSAASHQPPTRQSQDKTPHMSSTLFSGTAGLDCSYCQQSSCIL